MDFRRIATRYDKLAQMTFQHSVSSLPSLTGAKIIESGLWKALHLLIHFLAPVVSFVHFRFSGLEAVPFTGHCRLLSSFSR
jgi:hypothetical protein